MAILLQRLILVAPGMKYILKQGHQLLLLLQAQTQLNIWSLREVPEVVVLQQEMWEVPAGEAQADC